MPMILIYMIAVAITVGMLLKFLLPDVKFNFNLPKLNLPKRPALPKMAVPFWKMRLRQQPSEEAAAVEEKIELEPNVRNPFEEQLQLSLEKIVRLEQLLLEKNKEIDQLTLSTRAQSIRREDFEKMRALMEEEIQVLRQHNRALKAELATHASLAPSDFH